MGEKGLGGRDTGTGTRDVIGESCLCDCGGEEKAKDEWGMVRCCQAGGGFDIHQKDFGLYSVTNGDSWEGF